MKFNFLFSIIFLSSIVFSDLSQFIRRDERFFVNPIVKKYNEIENFSSQIKRWDNDFKGKYGKDWQILIDLRSGRPAYVRGQGIPVIPGFGNDIPYSKEITKEDVKNISLSFIKENYLIFNVKQY